ncbi:MAG TPA: DUF5916 domain-containing protein [Longimicrobiales bacterium]
MARPFLLLALLAAATPLGAQSRAVAPTQPANAEDTAKLYARKSLQAVRLIGAAPSIDGKLTESVWLLSPAGTDFIQTKPNPGKPATEKTEIRFAYDDAAIYIAARMYDSHPDSIVAQLARRDDDVYSEWVFVAIDSYFDRRTAFTFGLNPKGVKVDVLLFDDTNDDESWDAVWDGAARVDSLGWTAEFRIPLSQLRFSPTDKTPGVETVWGMDVQRRIARRNEESFWSPIRSDANAVVSAFGELRGIAGLQPPRRMEVLPYTMSRLTHAPGESANPFYHRNDGSFGAGADVKLGVTSDLTLTATINPDFGQVEADPSVVNLTAYETFFPEKRPFFVEGFDIFRAGIGVGDGDNGNQSLFYSRRIGRAPQGEVPDNAQYSDYPQAATILGAAKLSGKTRSGWSIGGLSALTTSETAQYTDDTSTQQREVVVEPLTHYGVARVIKDFSKGQDAIGGVFTAVNRDLPDNLKFLRANAYAGGLTGRHRWQNGNYQFSSFLMGSHVSGDTSAINQTQRSSARYFQRPDNDHVTYDPTRTSLSGLAGGLELLKMGGGHWRYGGALNVRTPGFEVNDLGFMQGTDQVLQVGYAGYDQYQPGRYFNRWDVNVNQWLGWTFGGERNSFGGNINASGELKNTADLWASVNREQEVLSESALRGGPAFMRPGYTNYHGGYDSDERKAVNYWFDFNYRDEDATDAHGFGIYPGLRLRASNQMELRLNPGISWDNSAWQYVDAINVAGADRYVFAALHQVTTSLTFRMSYTFTPNLSLQMYAEPFISAGEFSNFMEVANPRAARFQDRFTTYSGVVYDSNANEYAIDRDGNGSSDFTIGNPDFNYRALRSNMVLRWEYRPGSALFLVWSQGRERSADYGAYSFRRDADRLFAAQPTNVLLIKASYWLGL